MWRLALAVRAFLTALTGSKLFSPETDDEPLTAEQWAAMLILHAEAIYGCEHTDPARAELGIVGPRGKARV